MGSKIKMIHSIDVKQEMKELGKGNQQMQNKVMERSKRVLIITAN